MRQDNTETGGNDGKKEGRKLETNRKWNGKQILNNEKKKGK